MVVFLRPLGLRLPLAGRITDRRGAHAVIAGSLAAGTLLLAAQAAAPNPIVLCLLRLAQGVALAGLTPAVAAAIRQRTPSDRVGRVLGLNVSAAYVGQIVGPVLGAQVGGSWGVRSVFVATAVVMAVALAATVTSGLRNRARSHSAASAGAAVSPRCSAAGPDRGRSSYRTRQ
ncbi:hypothetical protein GCM10023147_52470 [Tsukamurella soli]|uniref:Major facilitator superfamily (MFS) profile domain-containing protein n=1 Tax=Tsukamurella soli TaxID=644556 RepID=A0ABP8KLE7_9ACTN